MGRSSGGFYSLYLLFLFCFLLTKHGSLSAEESSTSQDEENGSTLNWTPATVSMMIILSLMNLSNEAILPVFLLKSLHKFLYYRFNCLKVHNVRLDSNIINIMQQFEFDHNGKYFIQIYYYFYLICKNFHERIVVFVLFISFLFHI